MTVSVFCSDKNSDNTQDKNGRIKFTNLEIYKMSYWSTFGAVGLTSVVTSFAEMGYAYSISNEINSLASDMETYNANMTGFRTFSTYYPGIVFGINFLMAGFAFIPAAGGIVYGASLYMVAIAFCTVSSLNILNINVTNGGSVASSYEQRLRNIYSKILDPAPYFAVGSVSILLGVAEIILWIYYNRELKRSKFPYNQRRFAFSPGNLTFSIYL
jgi:magnesium-transporting ATPase (P-type)